MLLRLARAGILTWAVAVALASGLSACGSGGKVAGDECAASSECPDGLSCLDQQSGSSCESGCSHSVCSYYCCCQGSLVTHVPECRAVPDGPGFGFEHPVCRATNGGVYLLSEQGDASAPTAPGCPFP